MSNQHPDSQKPKPNLEVMARVPAAHKGPVPSLLYNVSTHIFPNLNGNHQPFTTGPNEVKGTLGLVNSNREPRSGPSPLLVFISPWPDHQVKEDTGEGRNPCFSRWVLLFMLAAQTILEKKRKKKKALYYSSTYAGCCLHTLPMP